MFKRNPHDDTLMLQVAEIQGDQIDVYLHPSILPILIQFLKDQKRRPSQKLLTNDGYLHVFLPKMALQEANLLVRYSDLPRVIENLEKEATKSCKTTDFSNTALH